MKNEYVYQYYLILKHKWFSLFCKRLFDILVALFLLIILSPLFLLLSIIIKLDSHGPIIFKQERVTQYGRVFLIYKFRTMINDADKVGSHVTLNNDIRITKVGKFLRKFRFDEIPQLINIIFGSMTFVGSRPEVPDYVKKYTSEMIATLLLPAGLTSEASIEFKGEDKLLDNSENSEETYINLVLPQKMQYNLNALRNFNFWHDIGIMFRTIIKIFKR